ncbi:hypothetical protein ACFXCZ_00985 [Streptomyces sp. NPDC059396]|uniref:hypothetical protein n=1 Tax=Streptomyces sp. NPDC059396 TaxID=3346819 RepID=UPI003695628C
MWTSAVTRARPVGGGGDDRPTGGWERWRGPVVAAGVAVPFYVLWAVLLATGGGDLAAQFAWAGFVARHPGSAYNLGWYGGTHTANYSVLAPPLMAWLGVRAVSVGAGLAGTWVLGVLFVRAGVRRVRRPLWPALLGAAALWCNVASGRTTFALGVAIGLTAVLCVQGRQRPWWAALCAALTALASPVAALFLVVAGAAYLLDRRWAKGAALIVPPFVVIAAITILFPFQGEQPMSPGKLWMPLVASAALCVAAPRGWRVVRYGAAVYAVGVVLTFLVASPIGTNVERLVGLAGPPVLLAALLTRAPGVSSTPGTPGAPGAPGAPDALKALKARPWRALPHLVLAAALAVNTNWLVDKTEDDLVVSNTVPYWAAHTDGLVAALDRLGADRTRVEVVPARNHREADILAPYITMARGWNRQLDVERGRLFYEDTEGPLAESAYRAWLDRWAVGLVVLHHGQPDGPAEAEAALVRSGPEWLERVYEDDGWTVYRVRNAVPLVSAPASVAGGSAADLVVRMPGPGSVTVRIAYSPWLRARGACVERAGEWVRLTVPKAGDYRLESPYRLPHTAADCAKG